MSPTRSPSLPAWKEKTTPARTQLFRNLSGSGLGGRIKDPLRGWDVDPLFEGGGLQKEKGSSREFVRQRDVSYKYTGKVMHNLIKGFTNAQNQS